MTVDNVGQIHGLHYCKTLHQPTSSVSALLSSSSASWSSSSTLPSCFPTFEFCNSGLYFCTAHCSLPGIVSRPVCLYHLDKCICGKGGVKDRSSNQSSFNSERERLATINKREEMSIASLKTISGRCFNSRLQRQQNLASESNFGFGEGRRKEK